MNIRVRKVNRIKKEEVKKENNTITIRLNSNEKLEFETFKEVYNDLNNLQLCLKFNFVEILAKVCHLVFNERTQEIKAEIKLDEIDLSDKIFLLYKSYKVRKAKKLDEEESYATRIELVQKTNL
jgi:hypothetical protein